MANEKTLELKLRNKVKNLGGIALKFHSPFFTGMPDRLVLLPDGKIGFVELKSEGKKPSARQDHVISELMALGFKVFVVDTNEKLDNCLNELQHGNH
jgi:hypothetical protein